jgi:hypothetical protein
MRLHHFALYAIAAAILILGVVAFDLPSSSLLLLAFVLVCPVMMFFMMRGGMHGMGKRPSADVRPWAKDEHGSRPGAGR